MFPRYLDPFAVFGKTYANFEKPDFEAVPMGYDLHITRKEDWSDDEGPEISLEDWIAYVTKDSSMVIDRETQARRDSRVAVGVADESMAFWTGWSGRKPGVTEAWMWHWRGDIIATDPDAEVRRKMFLIADALRAHVQGDDGEFYDSSGHPSDTPVKGRRRWWKFW